MNKHELANQFRKYYEYIDMVIPRRFSYEVDYFLSVYHSNTINRTDWTNAANEMITEFTKWK